MFRSEAQQCQAIRILLASLHMESLWTEKGPTRMACDYLEGSPLSHGEQILLRCAFDFWNGEGKVMLYRDLLGVLDGPRTMMVLTLAMAATNGANAVDKWIQDQAFAAPVAQANQDLLLALVELTSAVQDGQRRHAAGDPNAIKSNLISATLNQALQIILKANV
ncbi:MAG TPA: hypothetical protein VMQ17_08935 [Candidatus Sulfotelmatobacter sp.]|nr:hypothetical protein [Candidatus Sulfotelmatobacter sp.]